MTPLDTHTHAHTFHNYAITSKASLYEYKLSNLYTGNALRNELAIR